jgi:hypothetical protein
VAAKTHTLQRRAEAVIASLTNGRSYIVDIARLGEKGGTLCGDSERATRPTEDTPARWQLEGWSRWRRASCS